MYILFLSFRLNLIQFVLLLTGLACLLVQMFCHLSIAWTRGKYILEEKKRQRVNQHAVNLSNRIEAMDMNIHNNNSQPAVGNILVRLNTAAHNKTLLEVYHISFLTFAIAVNLASLIVKKTLKNNGIVEDYSHALLCFLDLTPRILLSVILPMMICARNPEMQTYYGGLFRRG